MEGAHYIGGFGRIFDLDPGELLVPLEGAESSLAAEPGIVEHMNEDHADASRALRHARLATRGPGAWRMVGIDPEGCDMLLDGRGAAHPVRTSRVATPARGAHGARPARRRSPRRPAIAPIFGLAVIRPCLESRAQSVLGQGRPFAHPIHHFAEDPTA